MPRSGNDSSQNILNEIDSLLAAGQVERARKALTGLDLRRVPRRLLSDVAILARRLSLPQLAIELLNPIVRPSARRPVTATPKENSEYGAALIAIGAREEGEAILVAVRPEDVPEVLLYRAYSLFSQWRYGEAIPLLQRFISLKPSEYQVLVGRVNLAAALVIEQQDDSSTEGSLEELRKETKAKGHFRLLSNVYELSAQRAVFQGDYERAELYLTEAERSFDSAGTLDAFFIQKWRIISRALRDKGRKGSARALCQLAVEATNRRHWETVRECDLFRAWCQRDRQIALHLYFGTPYEAYRKRVCRLIPFLLELPDFYDFKLGKRSRRNTLIDLREDTTGSLLPRGETIRRLFNALALDLYRPSSLAGLFSAIYPDQHYHPIHSPTRVHQLLRRLRRWLEKKRVHIQVSEKQGLYSFDKQGGAIIRIPRNRQRRDPRQIKLDVIKAAFGNHDFSVRQAAEVLNTTISTALRLLRWGNERHEVARFGAGPSTTYRFDLPTTLETHSH